MLYILTAGNYCGLKLAAVDAGAASVAKLRPNDNKDAFFTAAPNFYGVFDGVSQCPESRIYAQTLAKETSAALKRVGVDGSWSDQAQSALQQAAQKADRYSGSSTAVLMRMDLDQPKPQVCTYTLGDSSALVLRRQSDGTYVVGDSSGVQYHDNGAPFQLGGNEWQSDDVGDGLVEAFEVGTGDYVLCFSDGVSGNLALNDIARLVSACDGQSAEVVARTVVAAAKDAKLVADDITAVAVRVGEGGWVGGADEAEGGAGDGAGIVEKEVCVRLSKPLGLVLEEVLGGEGGVEVGGLVEGGNAAVGGEVREGDLLLRVGGTDVASSGFDDVMDVLADAPEEGLELTLRRVEYADGAEAAAWRGLPTLADAPPAAAPASTPAAADLGGAMGGGGDPASAAAGAVKGALGGLFDRGKAAAARAAADAADAAKAAAQKKLDEMQGKR